MYSFNILSLLAWISLAAVTAAVEPAAVYDGGYIQSDAQIKLKIGNGGAGQSGLIKELADAFIRFRVKSGGSPFEIAWYKSDTTETINYLKSNTIDVGITYSEVAETIAIQQGIAIEPSHYAFRDHFLLTGPPSNPANVSEHDDIQTIFSTMHAAAEAGDTDLPVRFLSRYDKSATNIKEALLWLDIGQVPWATAYSTWYHQYIAYPIQALTAAIALQEYTITDLGTYLSLNTTLQNGMTIFKAGSDNATDPLLNPAHLLIGAKTENLKMAQNFTGWLVSPAGQKVITDFKKNGKQLYTGAPTTDEQLLDYQGKPHRYNAAYKDNLKV